MHLLTAQPVPARCDHRHHRGSQLALQVHESCGHPIELDRVFGTEAAYAGTSFLTPDKLGTFTLRLGPREHQRRRDDAPAGWAPSAGTTRACRRSDVDIVKNGRFVGYLTDRESASKLGLPRSMGAARATGWNRIPLVRMTNVSLEPGTWKFDDLIADTDDGIYVATNRSWSIDDRRLNFQFGTEMAYEIKNGKLGALLKNATYTGMTPEFWRSCDAICDREHWYPGARPTAARASRGRPCTPATAPPRRASATCRWGWLGERRGGPEGGGRTGAATFAPDGGPGWKRWCWWRGTQARRASPTTRSTSTSPSATWRSTCASRLGGGSAPPPANGVDDDSLRRLVEQARRQLAPSPRTRTSPAFRGRTPFSRGEPAVPRGHRGGLPRVPRRQGG